MKTLVVKRKNVSDEPKNSSSMSHSTLIAMMRCKKEETAEQITFFPKDKNEFFITEQYLDYINVPCEVVEQTNKITVELPDATGVLEDQELSAIQILLDPKIKAEAAADRYERQREAVQKILEAKKANGLIDKTIVTNSTEVTLTTRKNYTFSNSIKAIEEYQKTSSNELKKLKAEEIKNGTAEQGNDTVFITVKDNKKLKYDTSKGVWLSTYSKRK